MFSRVYKERMNRYFQPMDRFFRPEDEDDIRGMLADTEKTREFMFMKLYDCLEDMVRKYPQQYPELQNWKIEVHAVKGNSAVYDKNLNQVMDITLPVLHYVAVYPTGATFADGVMTAYVFATINHELGQLFKKLYEINPRSDYRKKEEMPYIDPLYLETQQKYWEQKLDDLSPTIFGPHLRRKYAFFLCGIVKEMWFHIPHFFLRTVGLFGNHRLAFDKLDIDSYKTNCKDCNKTIVHVGRGRT
jgi:hypothetical protein